MVKNLPVNAGDTGSIPGPEDPTGHGATKPVCPTEPVLWSSRAETTEAPMPWSPCPAREATAIRKPQNWRATPAHRNWREAHTATKTQHSQK